jgi:hypothetical protein
MAEGQIVKDPVMSDANDYRREAEECRRNSESALRPIDREAWLRLAADYAKLAEGAELTQRLQDISRGKIRCHRQMGPGAGDYLREISNMGPDTKKLGVPFDRE